MHVTLELDTNLKEKKSKRGFIHIDEVEKQVCVITTTCNNVVFHFSPVCPISRFWVMAHFTSTVLISKHFNRNIYYIVCMCVF
jgi:hypothetical protein